MNLIMIFRFTQFVIVALLIAAVAADQAYPKPAYPAAYPKSYDYVSSLAFSPISINSINKLNFYSIF